MQSNCLFTFMGAAWVLMLLKGQKLSRGAESKFNKKLKMPAADKFMCSLLRTVVSFLQQRPVRVDWLGFIGFLCLYQRVAVVGVPVVLTDNTATPSLAAPIIIQSASSNRRTPSCHSSRALSDHKEGNGPVTPTHFS